MEVTAAMKLSLVNRDVDLLHGPIISKIFAFAVPLMISNLLQVLYSAADMIVVAQSGAEGAVGAIGTTNMLINLVINLFVGFSVGANVLVSRLIGAKDEQGIGSAVHTAVLAALLSGILGGVIGFVIARPMLTLMGDEGRVLELACKYSRIRFVGIPFLSLTNFCIAIFRGKGNSTTPLWIMSAAGIANVLMNLFFVHICGMDVDGVAWATVISNALSAGLLLAALARDPGPCRFRLKELRIDGASLREILRIGIPAAIQGCFYTISNLLISSSIITVNNRMNPGGSAVLDGHSAGMSIGNFATTCCEALELSFISITSQHCGARKYKRLRRFILDAYLSVVVFAVTLTQIISVFRTPLLSLYISEPAAFEAAYTRMNIMLTTYFICSFMSTGSQLLRGMGRSSLAAMITLIFTCVLRVVWILFVFPLNPTLECCYISYPLSWAAAAIAQTTAVFFCYRKLTKKAAEEPSSCGQGVAAKP